MSFLRSSCNLLLRSKALQGLQTPEQTRCIKRWVAPTLRELRRRAKLLGPQEPQPRSGFVEWNYRAELFAFGKRLNEEFQLPLLQTAFTQKAYVQKEQHRQRELGIEEADLALEDNEKLAERGTKLAQEYVKAYLEAKLPKLPAEGRQAFINNLLSVASLAHISSHLGTKELLFDAQYPPTEESLARSLLAVIGALAESSGEERAQTFVHDFICTQLSQKDPLDLWKIEDPEALLKKELAERKMGEPEPRLIGDCGRNTLLAASHVGIYVNKQMISQGFGEDVATAIKTASLNALQKLYGIEDHARLYDFQQSQGKSLNLAR